MVESPLYASNRKLKQQNFLRISCNGIKVGGKEVVTYLGGQLDQDLSGKSMTQKIIHKVNASLKFLYRKKMFLNQYCRKTVCMAMIQSRIDYASNFYYHGLTKFLQSRLQVDFTKGWFIWYKVLPLHRCRNLEPFARRYQDYVQ